MVEANFPNRPFRLSEKLWLIRQDIAANASLIGWELWIYKNSYSPTWSANGKANRQYILDGTSVGQNNASGFDFRNGDSWLILSGQNWVGHNADGTKTFSFTGAADYDTLGYAQVGNTINLPTIARASSLGYSPDQHSGIFGQAFGIVANRAASNFEHDFDYWWGNLGQQAGPRRFGASASWTPPMSLLNQIPNAQTGVGTGRLYTYASYPNGYIGAKDNNFRLTASGISSDFTDISISEATSGVEANVGAFVQGISKLALAINGASSSGYGATIKSYSLTCDGNTINARTGTTPTPLSKSGTVTITGKVTDSRGYTRTKSQTVTVLAYTPPTINKVSVVRALSDGTVDEQAGTYLRVSINAAVKSLKPTSGATERNALTYRVSTRPKGGGSWTQKVNTTLATGTISMNQDILLTGPYSITSSHDVLVEIVDDFTTSAIQQTVGVAAIAMHLDGNRGVGIGKFRENGMLDVAGNIFSSGVNVTPVGMIMIWPVANSAPSGWLRCYGTAISRSTYAALFAVIGTSIGAGDGSTTFNLPDFRGRTPVGYDGNQTEFNAIGKLGGAKTHTLGLTEIPAHTHGITKKPAGSSADGTNPQVGGVDTSNTFVSAQTASAGSGAAHNNLQPYGVTNFIIKAF